MVSNLTLKKNKLTLTFVSETDRFQNLYRLVSYFRISSKKSVDTTIQQMIKFDVLSASFIFLLTLFYSFKTRYKKEIYSFLIGQNLPGITNLSQKTFKETSKYVFPSQGEPFLGESQFYFNTSLTEHDLTHFYQNQTIKLKKKRALSNKSLIFNGKTISNFYNVKHSSHFERNGKFMPSIYDQTRSFNKNRIKTTVYNTNLSSPYHLTFQSFAAKNFAFSTIKKLEKEGTYLKFLELPLNRDFYFGIFQKEDVTTKIGDVFAKQEQRAGQNVFKFPQKRNCVDTFCSTKYKEGTILTQSANHVLQDKIRNKRQLLLTKIGNQDWAEIYNQNKTVTPSLFRKSQKNWFCLDQNKYFSFGETKWFSLYENSLPKKHWDNLRDEKNCEKFKIQPILLDELSSIFYNVNNLSKSLALRSHIIGEDSLAKPNYSVEQKVPNTETDLSKRQLEINSVVKEKITFTSANWWHFIFGGNFSLNSNFIVENIDFPFSLWTKGSLFTKQKQEAILAKEKTKFSYEKLRLDRKWEKKDYHHYLQLDEFPSKLSSIVPSGISTNQFSTKTQYASTQSVIKTKGKPPSSSQKKNKAFVIKHKFILRGSKFILNFSEFESTEQNCLNLQKKFVAPAHFDSSDIKNLGCKFNRQQKATNFSLKNEEEPLFLQKKTNNDYINKDLNKKSNLSKVNVAEENQSKTFHLFSKSPKLCLLKNEIKAIFSSSKNNSYSKKKDKKTFDLLSNRFLTSLDELLLGNSLDTLFGFLPQKNCSPNHKVLQSIHENDHILFDKDSIKQDIEKTSFLTQEKANLVNFNAKSKNKEKDNLKIKYTKKLTQLLQDFWSKKEEIYHKDTSEKDFTEKRKDNWFTFFIKHLSTQPRLMSGYQFPDLNEKDIDKLIKCSNSKKILINKIHFVRETSFFANNFRKNTVFRFQNPAWSIFSPNSKKEIYQQHPIDVYLPNNSIQRLLQGEYIALPENLFFNKNSGAEDTIVPQTIASRSEECSSATIESETKLPQAVDFTKWDKQSKTIYFVPQNGKKILTSGEAKNKGYQIKLDKNLVLQNRILGLNLDREDLCSKPKPLKFISKSLRLENSTEKQSFFVYQIPALLKIPSIWNPRFQKLEIAKTINKSKYTAPSLDFSKNILSSTNFLTDRKQHFFAIGNQVEREQENSFVQRPFSGSFFGLSYNQDIEEASFAKAEQSTFLVNKTQTDTNLQSKSLFKSKLQNEGFPLENLVFAEQKLREQSKNFDFIKKDFSILPLLSKVTTKQKDYFTNPLSFVPRMPSLHTESNFIFSEKNPKENLEKANKTPKTFLVSGKTYKASPKSFKSITGINFYSFFDISAFHSPNLQVKNDSQRQFCQERYASLNDRPSDSDIFTDFTQNNAKFERLSLTKKIVENSKLNVTRKQLSDKCDKQINTLQLVLPFLETDTFTTTWTKWLSSRYKKPAISYRFQKKVFYLPSNKKRDFFLEQKNRYQKNKWGEIEQQENRSKKGERDEDSLTSFSEQVYLPLTIKRSIHFPNTSKILPSKSFKFSFFTTKPLFSRGNSKESKMVALTLQKNNLNVTACEQGVESQNKSKEMFQGAEHFIPKNVTHRPNELFPQDFIKQNLVKKSSIFSANPQKNGNIIILPHKKLSFVSKNICQEPSTTDTFFWENIIEKNPCPLYEEKGLVTQIAPLSYFLSDTIQKDQTSLFYLKRLDTNSDRLDWQFYQWYPFLHDKYTYSPPSQSTSNEEFLNSVFKNKLRKRNSIYKHSRDLPIWKFHYAKSKRLKDLLPKISTSFLFSQKTNSLNSWEENNSLNFSPLQQASNSSDILNTFRKPYSLSHLQKKQSFSNLLFPKKKRVDICWEPITIRSWMVITQYCYAFFLVQSALYVYEKHMKKVLLSFAPLLSGRGILSGMPSFGEKLQDFLGGSTIDKNVLLFKKVSKRFQDIVAIDNKLPQLSEIVWFLRNFGRTANVNKIQGVLFVGPPGTGKTLLVQAIAGEAEVPVLVLSGSSFADGKKDKKGGQLLKRVFQRARVLAPSILFIDEIDTLGESRSHFAQDDRDQKNESSRIIESISHTEGKIQGKTSFSQNTENQSAKQVGLLTQFLVEMDGLARQQKNSYFFNNKITFGKPGGILVIGSTNRPKVLDPALTRPGRFDQVFYLSNPGKRKRIEILKAYTKNIGVSPSLPWDYLGDRTLGFSAADLSAIVNKSTIRAILSHTIHTIQSIEEGIESLPKLSQNQNNPSTSGENHISTYFLSLESQKSNNGNTILCKSISTSLSICTRNLDLQNKYKGFYFWTDQSKRYQSLSFGEAETKASSQKQLGFGENLISKFLQRGVIKSESVNLGKFKEPLQQSLSRFNLQENKRQIEFDHSLGIGISFLSRLPFYQAGKVMVQILLSKDPITLVATLWPKQELSFTNMFKESIHVKEVINRDQLEIRLISGYAGKAAETLISIWFTLL